MIASLAIVLLAGYISGNTLDNLFVTILMGVLCGGLCKNLWGKSAQPMEDIERRLNQD